MKDTDQLLKRAEKIGVRLKPAQIEKLSLFVDMILEKGVKMGLSGRKNREEIYEKDILDSLFLAPYIPPLGKILDIGSGVGIPGIPLKIIFPDASFFLLDAKRKAALFLEDAARVLSLTNLRIKQSRAEDIFDETFDLILGRAVAQAPHFLEVAHALLAQNGEIILQKGKKWDAEAGEAAPVLSRLNLRIDGIVRGPLGEQKLIFIKRNLRECFT
jgi:16S rRNA (guanine527-N7)-methyltransferase